VVHPPANRNLILILARDFASRLASAMFLVDHEGTVIYYNEAAEQVLGRPFIEGRGMTAEEWSTVFAPTSRNGGPARLEDLPIGIAMTERRPAMGRLKIRAADDVVRTIDVASFPLFAHADDFVGAVAIFWEIDDDVER
jgi:PAS domain-containing protein